MSSRGQRAIYRNCAPVVDTWYDRDGSRTVVDALTDAVAEAEGVFATELPPLYEVIDLDAISQLFEQHQGAARTEAILGFTYENWNVFIRGDGRIRVCDGSQYIEPEPVFDDSYV